MKEYDKFRIEWDCRRGMLELDKIIMPFFQQYFDELSEQQKDNFLKLLSCTDLQLFSYFFNKVSPEDIQLREIISEIQRKSKLTN